MIKVIPLLLLSIASLAQSAVIRFANGHSFNGRFSITPNQSIGPMPYPITWHDSSSSRPIESKADTPRPPLTLSPEGSSAVFSHSLNHFDYVDFPVRPGDTLTITYLPEGLTVRNKQGFFYPDVFAGPVAPGEYSALGVYRNPYLLVRKRLTLRHLNWSKFTPEDKERRKRQEVLQVRKELDTRARKEMLAAEQRNDSLHQANRIPAFLYAFNRDKITQVLRRIDVVAGDVPDSTLYQWMASHTPWQSGAYDQYYLEFVSTVVEEKLVPTVPLIHKSYLRPDNRVIFDRIASSPLFPPKDRDALLARELGAIREDYSRQDVQAYFEKFSRLASDPTLVAFLREEFSASLESDRVPSESLTLRNTAGVKTSLADILNMHKGKVVYVDFWASWCAPCRAAFPASAALRKELKDVVFLYLSLDDSPAKWQKALVQEGLDTHKASYLVLNPDLSGFIRQQKIAAIPRYMIFDKKGNLAIGNAPGAGSPETAPLLTKMTQTP